MSELEFVQRDERGRVFCVGVERRTLYYVPALNEEVQRLRLVQFLPTGDNHHNAAVCPYCSPGGADLAAQLRAANRELAKLRGALE